MPATQPGHGGWHTTGVNRKPRPWDPPPTPSPQGFSNKDEHGQACVVETLFAGGAVKNPEMRNVWVRVIAKSPF